MALSLFVGVVVAIITVLAGAAKYAPAVGWDGAAITLLVWTWLTIWPMNADEASTHATREDPGRAASDVLLLSAAVASLAAVGFFLHLLEWLETDDRLPRTGWSGAPQT